MAGRLTRKVGTWSPNRSYNASATATADGFNVTVYGGGVIIVVAGIGTADQRVQVFSRSSRQQLDPELVPDTLTMAR